MESTCYDLHGLTVRVVTDVAELADAIGRRLRPLATIPSAEPDLRIELLDVPVAPPPGDGRPVYDAPAGPVLYFEDADELFVDYQQRLQWRCHPVSGMTSMSIPGRDPEDHWLAAHPLLTLALMEVMKRRRRYSVHAACVSRAGRGIVLAGTSGAGKSTTAVGLARAGMLLLSDDMVFLEPRVGGLDVLGFPDEVDFTDHTGVLFPELVGPSTTAKKPWRPKRSVRPEAVGMTVAARCAPDALVLVEVADLERSRLVPVDAADALIELVPNVLLTEVRSSQAHLDALGELAGSSRCFRLAAGRDISHLAELVGGLVA